MLNLRPAIMFGLVLALLVTTAAAGSGRKHTPSPTCDDCTNKVNNCRKVCIPSSSIQVFRCTNKSSSCASTRATPAASSCASAMSASQTSSAAIHAIWQDPSLRASTFEGEARAVLGLP